jgi:hypothetical protein
MATGSNHIPSGFHQPVPLLTALVLLWASTVALLGCSTTQSPSFRSTRADESQAGEPLLAEGDRVLVLPLREGSCLPKYGDHVMCHITGEHLDAGEVPAGAGVELGELAFDSLLAHHADVVPFEESRALLAAADPAAVNEYQVSLGVQLGRKARADKVLMGVATRYEERVGSRFGSRDPASVAFSLALVDVATEQVAYRARFNRRQAPLTSNLLALPLWWKEGFGWWTRRQVAAQAMREGVAGLVYHGDFRSLWTNMPSRPEPRSAREWKTSPLPTWP